MTKMLSLRVEQGGLRLDKYLAQAYPELSRSQMQKLIEAGQVTVNSRLAKASQRLEAGDLVVASVPSLAPTELAAEDIPLNIVHEDDDLLVINKPPGLTVHPAPGHARHTLVNAVLAHCRLPDVPSSVRPGVVHRLDKDTSGLMLVAKTERAQAELSAQLKARSIKRSYLVLVQGRLEPSQGAIEAPIGRDPRHRQRMAVLSWGRPARTNYRVLEHIDGYSLVEATLETGRTHQIRVHFSAIGYPVAGDKVYGVAVPFLERQFVHAYRLAFRLPSTSQLVQFEVGLAPDLEHALEALRNSITT